MRAIVSLYDYVKRTFSVHISERCRKGAQFHRAVQVADAFLTCWRLLSA